MFKIKLFSFSSLVTIVTLYSCSPTLMKENKMGHRCDTWVKNFYREPVEDRVSQFKKFDIKKQYHNYICGTRIIHPPAIYLAEPLAMRGKEAVNYLSDKLIQTKNDLTIRDIIYIFTLMQQLKTYDVLKDQSLMRIINESLIKVKDEDWKKYIQKNISEYIYGNKL